MSQVIDMVTCREFMKETLERILKEDLVAIAALVEEKSTFLKQNLSKTEITHLTEEDLTAVFKLIFATHRKSKLLFEKYSVDEYKRSINELLYGDELLQIRFQSFIDTHAELSVYLRFDFAGELLHYSQPEKYWLWNRWMWDPEQNTGALPLVASEEFKLTASTYGEMYMNVGKAIAFVHEMAEAVEFQFINRSQIATNVYLSCVYIIYAYTIFKIKMTDEFNKVMPPMVEFSKRILGVHSKKKPVVVKQEILNN